MIPKQPRIASLTLRDQMNRRRPTTAKASSLATELASKSKPSKFDASRRESDENGDDGSEEAVTADYLLKQIHELRAHLDDERKNNKKRLNTYRQAQQQQAGLVSRLQAKVLQYKQRCSELENQVVETAGRERQLSAAMPSHLMLQAAQQTIRDLREESIQDLDTALKRIEAERERYKEMLQLNVELKEKLEEAHQTNEDLTNDLQKLSTDFDSMHEELVTKENEWKEEEIAFTEYYSSEHNRLLNLWREVVSFKRLFSDMKFTTERELSKMRGHINSSISDTVSACSSTSFFLKLQAAATASNIFSPPSSDKAQQPQSSSEDVRRAAAELSAARNNLEAAQAEIRSKDERIQQLLREVHQLEEKCSEADASASQRMRLQEDIDVLQSALRDVAHIVIQDAESREMDLTASQVTPHVHLSPSTVVPPVGSLKRLGQRTNATPAFAESTISAVQAALHKYQLNIHELQVKLQTSKEQLTLSQKKSETLEARVIVLEEKNTDIVVDLDSLKSYSRQLSQEKEMLQKALDSLRNEKMNLDKSRVESEGRIDNLSAEYDKAEKLNDKLEKLCRSLEDDKTYLQSELDRVNNERELGESNLRAEEERSSKLRAELLGLREEMDKAYLAKEMLEQQKFELENILAQLEKNRGDLELELERVVLDKSDLQEVLDKLQAANLNQEQSTSRLQEELKRLNEEKTQLESQCADQQSDLSSLKKELLQAEQTRLELESEKVTMHEKMKFLEMEKEKLEMELAQMSRDRADLSNELTNLARRKETLNEELMRLKQRLEQANETNARLNRDLEKLFEENEELKVLSETSDKEIQRFQELLASAHSEKETLEAIIFDTQSNLEATNAKKVQLEKEKQELLIKQEALKGQVLRLTKDLENSEKHARDVKQSLTQLGENQEAEYQSVLLNLKKQSDEAIRRLNDEKEQTRITLEKKMQQNLSQLQREKDDEIEQFQLKIEELQHHIESLCQQHEEMLVRAENDKQQALLIAQQDLQVTMEKLESVRRTLESEKEASDRIRREAATHAEQDRNNLNKMRDELNRIKNKLEETKRRADEDKLKLELKIEEASKERESVMKEAEELQVQLHMSEDKVDELQNQLQEATKKLRDSEVAIENCRKELLDTRRQLTDSNLEKDKYNSSNRDLRERIKHVESEKREQLRTMEEIYQKIAGLEDTKTSLEVDRNRLQNNLRECEREILQLQQQLHLTQESLEKSSNANSMAQSNEKDLQARLTNEIEERERLQLQLHKTKKQVYELEGNLELTRQELGKMCARSNEEDERFRAREQELLARIEDGRCRERKLEDDKHNVEVCLTDATQQLKEVRARLGGSEGRVRALDAQITMLETQKKEVEQKLSSVVLILRRIAGIQLDGSVNVPFKLSSPTRRYSPVRMQEHTDGNREVIVDVDPEAVRRGVKVLMQQVAQIERERDDYKIELHNMKKHLIEAQEGQNKIDSKLNSLQASLRSLQEEKNAMEAKLMQKQTLLQSQSEKLQEKSDESDHLRDKVINLEMMVTNGCEERLLNEDKLDKMKQALNRLESEKRMLKEELNKCENRSTQMEVHRMSLEGDLQRLQMIIQDKEASIQKLQERCESQTRTITSLEERCISLKSTIDQMNHSLEKASISEDEMKAEINHLHRALMEVNAHSQSDTDKLKQLQKQLSTSESERRVLTERMDHLQQSVNELRHANQMLSEQNSRLQNEVANGEVLRAGLESQLRLSSWPRDAPNSLGSSGSNKDEELLRQLQQAQRERGDYKSKYEALAEKVKALDKDKRNLERQLSSVRSSSARSKSYERMHEKAHGELLGSCQLDQLEQENRELRLKVRRLESQLADREAEIVRLKSQQLSQSHSALDMARDRSSELERCRAAQLQAEKLLEAREHCHRQQVIRLETQIQSLREQLSQESKRRQLYVLRSSRAGREMQQIRQALGDSLRTVSQDPQLDALLLEHEARKLDCTVSGSSLNLALPAPSLSHSPAPSSIK